MTEQFIRSGVSAAAVYSGSSLSRADALERLATGLLQVIFSVDLFNEGLDLPEIDTVMMLRPTESKILFLQQLGRGLRRANGKDKLVVLDFIGNHTSFLHKPQALAGVGSSYRHLADFARQVEARRLTLPDDCFINYDLQLINFLKSLDTDGLEKEYEALRGSLGRRPTPAEFYRSGASINRLRQQFGSWFQLVEMMGDLSVEESEVVQRHSAFLIEVETTQMTKSFKMVLLEALQELGGWTRPPTLPVLAERSWQVLERRRPLLSDVSNKGPNAADGASETWQRYWQKNPVNAWIGEAKASANTKFFSVVEGCFRPTFEVTSADLGTFSALVQELIDYRLAAYEVRRVNGTPRADNVVPFIRPALSRVELPYFPNLKIACGHFRTGRTDAEEYRRLGPGHGRLDPARHFIARASGDSMNGGKNPIRDGDYLLLELLTPANAGSISGSVMAIERQDEAGDNQYLLRVVQKERNGSYILRANNPAYADLLATDDMRTLARFKEIIDPLELAIGETFMREDIPALFGECFNPGSWHSGHVALNEKKVHVLLVTLNKQGKAEDHKFLDHWIDDHTFHWQSQNSTTPESKRGREIIQHKALGISLHLFVREAKLNNGKGAPFVYHGIVEYQSHTGSSPMNIILKCTE